MLMSHRKLGNTEKSTVVFLCLTVLHNEAHAYAT